jgi:hypothetical protein
VPTQAPVPPSALQPGQLQEPVSDMHCAQDVSVGVPVQVRVASKTRGAGGKSCAGDLQQICPLQSLLWLQLLGQLAAQSPWQQMGDVVDPLQSAEDAHCLGHAVMDGLRHTPWTARPGSSTAAEEQQASPLAVSQSASVEHPVGQSLAAVQMGVL